MHRWNPEEQTELRRATKMRSPASRINEIAGQTARNVVIACDNDTRNRNDGVEELETTIDIMDDFSVYQHCGVSARVSLALILSSLHRISDAESAVRSALTIILDKL